MFAGSAKGIFSLASHLWSNTSRRRHQFSTSVVSLKLPSWGPTLERPVPPQKPISAYMTYTSERYKDSKGQKLSFSTVGREWREMRPQQKARYEEDYQKRLEEYQKQMKEFSQNFASEKDQRLYLRSIKKQGYPTAYNVMVKDRASKLPREERRDYAIHMAKEDYKNLTSSELQTYQHMADNINKENKKNDTLHISGKRSIYNAMFKERTANRSVEEVADYSKKVKREFENLTDAEVRRYEELADIMSENNWRKNKKKVSKPRKILAYHVMLKERAAKLPKEYRFIYASRWAKVDYRNLSVRERQEYQKIADGINRKKIEIMKPFSEALKTKWITSIWWTKRY